MRCKSWSEGVCQRCVSPLCGKHIYRQGLCRDCRKLWKERIGPIGVGGPVSNFLSKMTKWSGIVAGIFLPVSWLVGPAGMLVGMVGMASAVVFVISGLSVPVALTCEEGLRLLRGPRWARFLKEVRIRSLRESKAPKRQPLGLLWTEVRARSKEAVKPSQAAPLRLFERLPTGQ